MAKERIFDLPETRGSFQLKGLVSGVKKDSFYSDKKTKTGKDMRRVNFGIEYADGATLFVGMQGLPQENVYFSKKPENKGEKAETEKVKWADRYTFNKEGFRLIGKNIGLKKTVDENGELVNDKKNMTEFDACKEVKDNLKDGSSVYTRGRIDYSSFIDDKGNKKVSIKFNPDQISLCSEVDFSDLEYSQVNDFGQVIVFMGIEKEMENEKHTGRFVLSAKIITYSTIEDVEFIVKDEKLASNFRKRLKPYNAIRVTGHIESVAQIDTVSDDDDDEWGEPDPMKKVSAPTKREFIVTGAKGTTLDTEMYSKKSVDEALDKIAKANKAESDFNVNSNDKDEWGEASNMGDDEPW